MVVKMNESMNCGRGGWSSEAGTVVDRGCDSGFELVWLVAGIQNRQLAVSILQ
jgi:hypothetical protein